jgi:hypothetical protein
LNLAERKKVQKADMLEKSGGGFSGTVPIRR